MNDSIRFRDCTPDDCAEVLRLWKAAGATPSITDTLEEVRRTVADPSAIFLVATDADGRVVGSVIGGWDGWRGSIIGSRLHPKRVAIELRPGLCAK